MLYKEDKDGIRIDERTWDFLKSHSQVIDQLAIGGWVEFTEQYTSAPKLFQKIHGVNPSRTALTPYRKFLVAYSNNRCFYCGQEAGGTPHADHVIPWSYILEHKAWNLVLTCGVCNRNKWHYLPSKKPFLEERTRRNHTLVDENLSSFPNGQKIKKDFAEWIILSNLDNHIHESWDKAQADGFREWPC
jgi:CRISPR/Cas system Type II protein with McrA/HNH and RuvC-like nuclease domain